jgi:prepilin-type N-terminal cleavage/methylation domain-containing protein
MKTRIPSRVSWLAVVCHGLPWFAKPPQTTAKNRKPSQTSGYTLMEVLASSAVVAVGMTAMASLSGTLMIQEELGWRVAVVRNYQENMARLWQLGIDQRQVMNIMPTQTDNAVLNQIINGTPVLIQTGTTTPSGLGTMQAAAVTASVNISQDPRSERQGAALTLSVYRPSLPTSLRPVVP